LEVGGHLHVPAALPRGKSPRYPLDRWLSEPRKKYDDMKKRRSYLYRDSNSIPSAIQHFPDYTRGTIPVPEEKRNSIISND
jgi:hypothetical protein